MQPHKCTTILIERGRIAICFLGTNDFANNEDPPSSSKFDDVIIMETITYLGMAGAGPSASLCPAHLCHGTPTLPSPSEVLVQPNNKSAIIYYQQ